MFSSMQTIHCKVMYKLPMSVVWSLNLSILYLHGFIKIIWERSPPPLLKNCIIAPGQHHATDVDSLVLFFRPTDPKEVRLRL